MFINVHLVFYLTFYDISLPIRTLFNCHGQYAPEGIGFSMDSKYLITVGNEPHPIIKFWLWTLGKDEPDGKLSTTSCKNYRLSQLIHQLRSWVTINTTTIIQLIQCVLQISLVSLVLARLFWLR